MDNRTADATYYRKAARIFHTLRYVVLLVLVVFVIIGFTSFRRELTYDNFRYIMRYVSFNLGADYKDTSTLTYIADEESLYGYLKGDLAVLSPKGFRTYDFSGSELLYEKLNIPNPCMKTSGKYALCYDVYGTDLELYNSYSNIISKQFEYGIKDACVRSDGSYAVATSAKYLKSKLIVFEESGEFSYDTRDKEIIAVSLPDDSDKVNFIGLLAENGDFKFHLMSYNTRSDKPIMEKVFTGEFPLKLYSTKKMICVLTDKALHFVNYDGETVKSFKHSAERLSGFYQSSDYIALTYTRSVSDAGTMRIFHEDGYEVATENFGNNIISFSAYKNRLYALEQGVLHIMDVDSTGTKTNNATKKKMEVDGIYNEVFATSSNEYILVSGLGAQQVSE